MFAADKYSKRQMLRAAADATLYENQAADRRAGRNNHLWETTDSLYTKSLPKCRVDITHATFRYPGQLSGGLQDVSFSVGRGEHVVLLGASGGGKSTLLRLVARLIRPQSGTVQVVGKVGFVQQDPADQIVGSSVWEDVSFGPFNFGLSVNEVQQRVHSVLQMVGIEGLATRSPVHLSSGELQQVAIAGVLALEPDILLLDEPAAYLDVMVADRFTSLVRRLCSRGISVVQATHSLRVCRQADRMVVLHQGGVLATGEPATVLRDGVVLRQAGLLPAKKSKVFRAKSAGCVPACRNSEQPLACLRVPQVTEPLSLYRNSCLAVCGPTGSGKTAFALSLLGLDPSGLPLPQQSSTSKLPTNLRLAVMFQQPERYFWGSTVEEELLAALGRARSTGGCGADEPTNRLLASLGLSRDVLQRRPETLSDGEQRRVALAIALVSRPDILVADQPVAGLDIPSRQRVESALRAYVQNGGSLVLVTHERRHLYILADECVVLSRGDVVYRGSAQELARNTTLMQTASLDWRVQMVDRV